MACVILLTVANVFMTIAWYGHLKFTSKPLWAVVLISWMIAFVEYCFQVPANRIGYRQFSGYQLKIIQEVITLSVFVVFAAVYLKEGLRWNYLVGFGLLIAAVAVIFAGKPAEEHEAVANVQEQRTNSPQSNQDEAAPT